uniref:Anterior gradient 1 n=1 Tax=Tetraodon nigroviridis TaxID=99883 RepID=H3BYW7_TETNG
MLRWVLLLALCATCGGAGKQKKVKPGPKPSLARGWGGSLKWARSYEHALAKMVQSQKPLMVIHHKEECRFSQALKKAFADEQSIQEMAKDFIMLNLLVKKEETPDPNLAPDGYYVPRILFVDPSMTVRTDIRGKYSNRQYAYEPGDMADLLKSMKKAKVLIHTEL